MALKAGTEETRRIASKGGKSTSRRTVVTQQIISALNEEVRADPDNPKIKISRVRLLAQALIEKAISGDIPAIKEVIDRVEGKPAANLNVNASHSINTESEPVSDTARWIEESLGTTAHSASADSLPN